MNRISVDAQKKEVSLSFNTGLYSQNHIDQAIADYLDVCEIFKVDETLVLKPKDEKDLEIIGYEFYNYVLGLMKNT
jgi:hypothetical protein